MLEAAFTRDGLSGYHQREKHDDVSWVVGTPKAYICVPLVTQQTLVAIDTPKTRLAVWVCALK